MTEIILPPLITGLCYIYWDELTLIGLLLVLFISGGFMPFVCWYGFKFINSKNN